MSDSPWYGFNYGPIHFTIMSTEHDFTPGSSQVSMYACTYVRMYALKVQVIFVFLRTHAACLEYDTANTV